jgi:signal transduction histidine kinase
MRGGASESDEGRFPRTVAEAATYERRRAVAVVCSELVHELAPTLAFLREIVRARLLEGEHRLTAEEESARLAGVVTALRRAAARVEESWSTVSMGRTARAAAARAREETGAALDVLVDVPSAMTLNASEPALELVLTALLRNALSAAAGAVTLRAQRLADGWRVAIEDDGPGLPEPLAETLFLPLATLGAGGRGAALAVVVRTALEHGWEFEHVRSEARTVMSLRFPDPAAGAE